MLDKVKQELDAAKGDRERNSGKRRMTWKRCKLADCSEGVAGPGRDMCLNHSRMFGKL